MSKKKVRLALIGKGSWGKNYIRTIAQIPSCELPSQYIKTTDYKDLFSYKDIDGVIIATPPSTHFKIASELLKRGYNLLIEKPMTTSLEHALKLRKLARQTETVVMVGHLYRYHPAFIRLKELAKTIGKLRYIQSEGMDFGPVRGDVSALWDWGPHDISMCLAILGVEPLSVAAWGISTLRPKTNLYDMASLKLTFPKNITALITIGWLAPVKKRSFTVVGEKESLLFDDIAKQKVIHIEKLDGRIKVSHPTYSHELPLNREVLEFIDCIKRQRKPKTDLMEGVLSVKIMEAAEVSIRSGGREISIGEYL